MISKRFESAVMASKIGVPVLTKELPELYESGQYFINPQFGYRGVVLFPQQVRVLHDKQLSTDSVSSRIQPKRVGKILKGSPEVISVMYEGSKSNT